MADLPVVSCCAYLTAQEVEKRKKDWPGVWMTKAIKGDPMPDGRYFEITVNGARRRFDKTNISEFLKIVPLVMAAAILARVASSATLVPVPNSHVTSADAENFRTLQLAEAIARNSAARYDSSPALVFRRPMNSARKGGLRSAFALEAELEVTMMPKRPIILIDDVRTTGGHLKACAWRLQEAGAEVILAATFSRTTHEHEDKPVGPHDDSISLDRPSFFGFSDEAVEF